MIARLHVYGQETWHHNVVRVTGDGDHLTLELDAHPSRVHYWLHNSCTSILLCADSDEVTRALREERPEHLDYCTCLSIGRDSLCPVHGDL